jgi:hypothetical protein
MSRHILRSTIFITAMLAASAAFASAGIVKCVAHNGKVTLTDGQCGEGIEPVVRAEAAAAAGDEAAELALQPAAPVTRRAAIQRVAYAPPRVRHDSWAAARPSTRMLSRDVETLRAARLSMQVLDGASAATRQQRLAGLN